MKPFVPRRTGKSGPEAKIAKDWVEFLLIRGWFCIKTHGNEFQSGLPDYFCTHSKFGIRWTEIKNPGKFAFTPAQIDTFPKMIANGAGVWIITAATEEEYAKLFQPCNYWHYANGWIK